MENSLVSILVVLLSALGGGVLVWWAMRQQTAAAFANGKSVNDIELARATERLRSAEEDTQRLSVELKQSSSTSQVLSTSLAQVRDDLARAEERAKKIPELERQIEGLANDLSGERQIANSLREVSSRQAGELEASKDLVATSASQLARERERAGNLDSDLTSTRVELADVKAQLVAQAKSVKEQLELLQGAQQSLSNQFKSVATEIFEEKSKRFTEENQSSIGQLLNPLRERIVEFKSRLEEVHTKDTEQQAALRSELKNLQDLNRQMSEEAHSLATALKGQSKMRGDWGELVLQNVLARSGLREGIDFERERSFSTDDGKRRPDVLVHMPPNKHLVIDAKVSLNAYTRYVNADGDTERQLALKEHISAIKNRIKELSDKSYFSLPGLNSPEVVFMFVPIESAFVDAIREDDEIFEAAVQSNVLVATPTTLLTSLKIVRQLWRFEEQNEHTAELAASAEKVYKKLTNFLGSMDALGKQLDKARDSFGAAMGQLKSGRGNLISLASDFERLGVSVGAKISSELAEEARLQLDYIQPGALSDNLAT